MACDLSLLLRSPLRNLSGASMSSFAITSTTTMKIITRGMNVVSKNASMLHTVLYGSSE